MKMVIGFSYLLLADIETSCNHILVRGGFFGGRGGGGKFDLLVKRIFEK